MFEYFILKKKDANEGNKFQAMVFSTTKGRNTQRP